MGALFKKRPYVIILFGFYLRRVGPGLLRANLGSALKKFKSKPQLRKSTRIDSLGNEGE